ncbi:MAG TPA: ASPIC/UnbV domain-containing protein, partial [Gemmatimonadaceae bacterium]|nr:ASPIC/UnbV domain-containing protein [Gemmatimonadaceae bacterium]
VIVANQNQPAVVYRDYPDSANHWIAFKLIGTRSNRSAIGAEVVLEAGLVRQRRVIDGGSGFASQNDRRLHFGLGSHEWVDRVIIYWPSGTQQVISRPPVDGFVTVTEPDR